MFCLEPISTSDLIQIVAFAGAILSLFFGAQQLKKQSEVAKAQFLRDSFDMLWKTYEPVTQEAIDDFRKYPREVISLKLYETRYKGKPDKEHRYLKMARLYEYLVFAYHVKGVHKSTPVDEEWLQRWIAELKREQEFQDVHETFQGYYPKFRTFYDTIKPASDEFRWPWSI